MPGFDEPLRGQLPDGLITPATIYLIKLCYWLFLSLYRRRCLRVSRSSSLDFCQPTSPTSPSALSPWKPSPTGFDGCLRRRPVPLTTVLALR